MKDMSSRQKKIAEIISKEVANHLIQCNFSDPEIATMVTIPSSWVSPDLKHARVSFSTITPQNAQTIKNIAAELNANRHIFQHKLASLGLKFTPKIKFAHNDFYEQEDRITAILQNNKTGSNNI